MASDREPAPEPSEGRVDFGKPGGGGQASREQRPGESSPGGASSDHGPGTDQPSEEPAQGAVPSVEGPGSEDT